MNMESDKRTYFENLKFKIIFAIMFLWLNSGLVGAICWFIQGAGQGESLTALTYAAPCITFTFLTNSKALSILFYENEVNKLISCLKELEKKQANLQEFDERTKIIKKEIKILHQILKVYNVFNWAVIITFNLLPLTVMAIKYFATHEIELLLPLLIAYPFNPFNIFVWPFVYFHQSWAGTLVSIPLS